MSSIIQKVILNHTIDVTMVPVFRLSDFIKEGCGQCKCELAQLLYPTFVNIYLDLIARGVSAVGKIKHCFKKYICCLFF